jgi:hypothetical protein
MHSEQPHLIVDDDERITRVVAEISSAQRFLVTAHGTASTADFGGLWILICWCWMSMMPGEEQRDAVR